MNETSLFAAFVAGLLSFLSPCVMPLMPAYMSMVSGLSVDQLRSAGDTAQRNQVLFGALSFIAGFTTIFVLGGASATAVGRFVQEFRLVIFGATITLINIAGVVIIIFGLHLTGVLKIAWLYQEKRVSVQSRGSFIRTFLLGAAFAFGWTPCIGPILAGILALAAKEEQVARGVVLLFCYSMGLGIPFLLTAISLNKFFEVFGVIKKHMRKVEIASGVLLIAIGILVATDSLTLLNRYFGGLGDLSLWLEETLL